MFKHSKVVPITAAKRDSKQQSKQETIPPIRAILQIAFRQMLESAQHYETQVLQNRNVPNQAHQDERRSFICRRAAAMTAAKHSPAFSVA
jgi:hypothetical protein